MKESGLGFTKIRVYQPETDPYFDANFFCDGESDEIHLGAKMNGFCSFAIAEFK